MKRCTKCEVEKDETCFGRRLRYRNGVKSWCRPCEASYHAARYARNRTEILARTKTWFEANKDQKRRTAVAWKRANLDKVRQYNNSRKAARLNAAGSHTASEARALLVSQDHLCANRRCRADLRVVKKHLDHKTPFVRGGSNAIENLQWLCAPCNLAKHTLDQGEWSAREEAKIKVAA